MATKKVKTLGARDEAQVIEITQGLARLYVNVPMSELVRMVQISMKHFDLPDTDTDEVTRIVNLTVEGMNLFNCC